MTCNAIQNNKVFLGKKAAVVPEEFGIQEEETMMRISEEADNSVPYELKFNEDLNLSIPDVEVILEVHVEAL